MRKQQWKELEVQEPYDINDDIKDFVIDIENNSGLEVGDDELMVATAKKKIYMAKKELKKREIIRMELIQMEKMEQLMKRCLLV